MGKDTEPKKKCCRKYRKKNEYCKRCPVKIRLECLLEEKKAEKGKEKDEKKSCKPKEKSRKGKKK